MGKLGEEVSQKIKSAIKAKLMELGIHIDNELPDYVMVLVANKKTQQQMEDDLSLFLGDSTKAFTSWLHNVLKKLEQVTISTKAKKKDKSRKRGVDHDSNGVSSTKKVKSELDEVKKEPAEGSRVPDPEPGLEHEPEQDPEPCIEPLEMEAPDAQGEDTENEDAVSLTDHTDHHEPESTCEPVNRKDIEDDNDEDEEEEVELEEKEEENVKSRKPTSEEPKQRERIKIVWDKEEQAVDRPSKSKKEQEGGLKSKKSDRDAGREKSRDRERVREKERDRRTRSRSRSRTRYTNKKKSREEDERDRSRNRSRDRYSRKQSSSPKRKSSGDRDRDRKVVDARDILKRKGADKKLAASKSRRRDSRSPPFSRRRSRSKSRDPPRENKMSSVLKAVIRVEKPPPTIPSMVKVTPRPVRPPSMQPNCNLILKAVADAEKSLATSSVNTKKVKESYEDKPSKKDRKRYGYAVKGNISVTLLNDRVVASKVGAPMDVYHKEDKDEEPEVEKYENETSQEALAEEDTMSMALDADDYIDSFEKEDQYVMEVPSNPVEEYRPTKKIDKNDRSRFIISLDSTASDNENDNELDSSRPSYEVSDDVTSTTAEPVVEKKGEKRLFDRSRLGPKVQLSATSPTTSTTPTKKPIPETLAEMTAALTRCKYWPNCESGDGCPYVHPSSLCRAFPTCHFGDKCLYIHPACKFADNCLNAKCPYAHTSKTPVAKAPRPFLPISNPQLCIYYPNCTKPFCPFVHVKKPCRFGAACMKLGCDFDHGNANKNPFKWVASTN